MRLENFKKITETRFFSRKEPLQKAWQVIECWEIRRIPYNFLVGVVGMVSIAMCFLTAILTKYYLGVATGFPDHPFSAIVAVILYGVFANICYTLGWMSELTVVKVWPEKGEHFGTIMFALGLVFSLLLTLLLGVLVAGYGAIELLRSRI